MDRHHKLTHLLLIGSIFLLLNSCVVKQIAIPVASPVSTSLPTERQGNPSPDATTLNSLEKLDDYPFYVMHYSGEYAYPNLQTSLPKGAAIACSLFAALGKPDAMLYGRNFDWEYSPSLLLFTNPPDGYASASMVDLTFLDITPSEAKSLAELPIAERDSLLAAPSLPFDGMNEYGLVVGMAAVPDEYADDTSNDPSRPGIGSIGIIRLVLDHARNVDEAIALFGQYNIDFSGGPPIHYLLADPSGKSALVEFYQGRMVTIPNEGTWHAATNHLRCIAQGDGGCYRYRTISDKLTSFSGALDPAAAFQLLSDVSQDTTQWSSVYDISNGDIRVVIARLFPTIYSFHLDLHQP